MNNIPNQKFNCWAHDRNTFELYRARCRKEAEEMTCAAQAAEILATLIKPGETILDAGCAGGYYYWSFHDRKIPVEYYGLDYTAKLIKLAHGEICRAAGFPPERFSLGRIEDIDEKFDNVICFNVLTNSPHYAEPLEKLLLAARKRILLRESMGDQLIVKYTPDSYLDPEYRHLRVYHNTYPLNEVIKFMEEYGFQVKRFIDKRSGDKMEMVVDIPHYWKILLGERKI